jgi:hypothetical protein
MLDAKGIEKRPKEAVRAMWGAVKSSLRHQNGKSVKTVGQGSPERWQLVP